MDIIFSIWSKLLTSDFFLTHLFFSINQDNTVEKRREIAIRCLIVYLGEKEEDLFKQYSVSTWVGF